MLPCLIKQQCGGGSARRTNGKIIHSPTRRRRAPPLFPSTPYPKSPLLSPKRGFQFRIKLSWQAVSPERKTAADGGGDLSTAPTLVSPVIPKIHSFRPQNSSGSLEGKSGRARILMVPPLTPTGYERNTFSCIASTSSTPIR